MPSVDLGQSHLFEILACSNPSKPTRLPGGQTEDKFDRIFQLHAILSARRTPLPLEDLMAPQVAYLYAAFDPATAAEKKEEYRRELLNYCERDTWAMVVVARRLMGKGRPEVAPLTAPTQ